MTPNLPEVLKERFNLAVEVMDPLRNIENKAGVDSEWLESIATRLAVAIGLATRKLGD